MPPSPARFILVRRLPTGEIKAHSVPFMDIPRAAAAAAHVLKDNAGVGSATARLFGDALARRSTGTVWGHSNGYDFRILVADFTEDGQPITPGMRVFNYYDQVWGTIDAGQFMDRSVLSPGSQFFDGWYDFTEEGDTRSFKKLNGQRLATKEPKS